MKGANNSIAVPLIHLKAAQVYLNPSKTHNPSLKLIPQKGIQEYPKKKKNTKKKEHTSFKF